MKNLYYLLILFVSFAVATETSHAQAWVATATKYTGSSSSSINQTFSSPSTTGHLIVVHLSYDNVSRQVSTLVDTKGNNYIRIHTAQTWNTTFRSELWYAYNITGGPGAIKITATLSGASSSFLQIYMSEYSGISNVSPLDLHAVGTGTSTTVTSGSGSTTAPNELIVGVAVGSNGTITGGGTFTTRSNLNDNIVEDKIGATAGSYSATFSSVTGNHWVAELATFKPLIPLPVKLINFDARVLTENRVQLDWATAMETNNDHFDVQHSSNGSDWAVVSEVKGAGTTNRTTQYSAIDNKPYPGVCYYRLAQFDMDGRATYSETVAVHTAPVPGKQIKIYPVPADSYLTVEGGTAELQGVSVINSIGQWMNDKVQITRDNDQKITLSLSLLPRGVYFLKTKDKSYPFYKQ